MKVWVVIIRNGPHVEDVKAFSSEENMGEAGYQWSDVDTESWPHSAIVIFEVEVDYG